MLKEQAEGDVYASRQPGWVNLREDIVELFVEAQERVAEDARIIRARIHYLKSFKAKQGFNNFSPGGSFYAKQRTHYSHHVLPKLAPPSDSELVCEDCGYHAHTSSQLRAHQQCSHRPRMAKPMIYTGTPRQTKFLKRVGWF